jgi:quercetin dioxygenase-like cupin family protein
MTFIDTERLPIVERRPGWHGRYFNSTNMTFGHYIFDAGAIIHCHQHPQEEVWQIIEGEVEMTVGEVTHTVGPGWVGIVPPSTPHALKALTSGRAIVVDHPRREGFG